MNPHDDTDLIAGLQAGLADRTAGVRAPEGMGADARRAARRRTTRRAVGAGVPVLAAAGVATVLLAGSGGGRAHATIAPAAPGTGAPGGASAQDTAYIVKRVTAKVGDGPSGTVLESFTYYSGDAGTDGSLTNLGNKQVASYRYTAPDGTDYTNTQWYYEDGHPRISYFDSFAPDATGSKGTLTLVNINPASRIYSQTESRDVGQPIEGNPTLGTPAEVRQALQDGQVSQTGTTTIDGTSAIVLSVKQPHSQGIPSAPATLLVDAHTYQPLRLVSGSMQGSPLVTVDEWVPATAANVALAHQTVPADFRAIAALAYRRTGGYSGNSGAGPLAEPDTGSGNSGNSGNSGQ